MAHSSLELEFELAPACASFFGSLGRATHPLNNASYCPPEGPGVRILVEVMNGSWKRPGEVVREAVNILHDVFIQTAREGNVVNGRSVAPDRCAEIFEARVKLEDREWGRRIA